MKNNAAKRGVAIVAAALLFLPASLIPARAATPMQGGASALSSNANIEKVRWHGRHRHHHWRHDDDFGPGAAFAAGLIGSLVAEGLSHSAAEDAIDRCEARYRSFEPDTGYYTTYGGEQRLCPYLR